MTSLDELVGAARAGLRGDGTNDDATARSADREVVGTALDGQVSAVLSPSGRLRALTLDPAALRLPLADVSAAIVAAVNEANALRVGAVDVTPVVELLAGVRDQVRAEAAAVTSGLVAADATVRSMRSQP